METLLSWLVPVLGFEFSMFVTIYVVARAILREEHEQEARERAAAVAPREAVRHSAAA